MNFKEFLNETRVLNQSPGSYIIIYHKEKVYLKYGNFPNNNKAVQQTWNDELYYGTLHEYYEDMKKRRLKGFKEITLKEAKQIETNYKKDILNEI